MPVPMPPPVEVSGLTRPKNKEGSVVLLIERSKDEPMKKLTLSVTKWLGDIPVEAHCTQCPAVSFQAQGTSHRANRGSIRNRSRPSLMRIVRREHSEV
jgi:hypothetical protein